MRSLTLRWLVLLATVLITVIVAVQLFWLNRVYSLEQKNFTTNVVKSIRGLYEDFNIPTDTPHLQERIENTEAGYFLFRLPVSATHDSLVYYMKQELNDFDVLTDTYLGHYKSTEGKYASESYISTVASRYRPEKLELPLYQRNYDYVILYFPHRNKYILAQMNFWFISSAILFIVLIGLGISLFYFYRQRFFVELQKDFVNNFTHEFKTPLAVMKISADVLLQDKITAQPERLQRYASIIQNQTQHLQSQVERLLRIAASDRKELPIEKAKVQVNEIIEQAVAKVQPIIEDKHATVEIQLNGSNHYELFADKTHLELAVVNLLENSLKYSSNPHVVVATGTESDNIFISVKDNGVGIDKKFHKNLFKKFYRVPTGDVHNVKGFGLGLNFVKRIIDAHHGTIKINSVPGIGTEFRLLIPQS